jgi:hypothetical protein
MPSFVCSIIFVALAFLTQTLMAESSMEEGNARYITLPQLNISVYMNTIFEPHNALVHASQNFLNFCMGTIFWVTSAALYYKVNPISGARRADQDYFGDYVNYQPELQEEILQGENAIAPLGS